MKKLILLLAVFGWMALAVADDLTTTSGKVYKSYAIMGADAGGIIVLHEEGKVVLPVKEFPEELQPKIARYAKEIPLKQKAAAKEKAEKAKKQKEAEDLRKKREAAKAARIKKYKEQEAARLKKEEAEKKAAAAKTASKSTSSLELGKK